MGYDCQTLRDNYIMYPPEHTMIVSSIGHIIMHIILCQNISTPAVFIWHSSIVRIAYNQIHKSGRKPFDVKLYVLNAFYLS